MADAEDSRSHSFWATFPGILTALAAVITAIGGVIAMLFQAGIIGGAHQGTPPPTATQAKVGSLPTTSASAGSVPGEKPWRDVEAVITAEDGTVTKMRAETVRFCISAGTGINLNDSQDIAFEKIARIDVLRSDVALSPGGKAALRVGLDSGSTLEGTITSGCDFFGQTEVGRYSLYPDKLLKIEFLR